MIRLFSQRTRRVFVDGSTTDAELEHLEQLVTTVGSQGAIVEIGSHRGRSAIAMAHAASKCGARIYAVDPHADFVGVNGRVFGPDDMKCMYEAIARSKLGEYIYVVALPSVDAAKAFDANAISVLFLDGDHSEAAVEADVTAWREKVRKGGLIAFHDSRLAGVKKQIDRLEAEGWTAVGSCESITTLKKPDV